MKVQGLLISHSNSECIHAQVGQNDNLRKRHWLKTTCSSHHCSFLKRLKSSVLNMYMYVRYVRLWKAIEILRQAKIWCKVFFRFPFNRCGIGLCSIPWCSDKTPPFTIVVCAFLCYANHPGTWNSGKVSLPQTRTARVIGNLDR